MSRISSSKLSKAEIEKLSFELSRLSAEHTQAMRDAAFVGLSEKGRAEMARRRKRITEIGTMLGKITPKQAPKTSLIAR